MNIKGTTIGNVITMQSSPESPGITITTKIILAVITEPQIRYFLFGIAPIEIPNTIGSKINNIFF